MPMFEPGLYRVRSRKFHTFNPSSYWYNNYLIFDEVGADYVGWSVFAQILQAFEAELHFNTVYMDRISISTYEEDSSPYDANEFISIEESIQGVRNPAGNPTIALETCWYLAKTVATGRSGKAFYRGALGELDVEFGGRGFNLSNPSSMASIVEGAITSSGLIDYLDGGDAGLSFAMPSGTTTPLDHRNVISFASKGVRNVNMDHRYFNRS